MSQLTIGVPGVPGGAKAVYKTVSSSNPAANTECSISVPANKTYVLRSATVTCAQGSTQTPLVRLVVKDASSNVVFGQDAASAATSASTTTVCNWYPGATLTAGAGATTNNAPIPNDLVVPGGYTVETVTAGKGANTDLSALSLNIVEIG